MSLDASRQEAKAVVNGIFNSHRRVAYEHWEAMGEWNMETRRIFEMAFLDMDKELGPRVITLAKSLYSNNARFLFELLRNCEENFYNNATARGEMPFVLFEVHPDHIITECNEDGFTKENLAAICDIGKSSKMFGTRGYKDAKSIGFKSVFKVAYKAMIQSGHFSFSFTHRKSDSGIGMVSPKWEEDLPPIDSGRTRITLWLHQDEEVEGVSSSIKEQFESLCEEMLLFMKKIQSIEVRAYGDKHRLKYSSTYAHDRGNGYLVTTTNLRKQGDKTTQTTKHFHLTRYIAKDLPKSEGREYSDAALACKLYSRSEIVLAFPLTENCVPILQPQWLFSFLPVRLTAFKFIIQADFMISADMRNIEKTSARNSAIGQAVANAFMQAVLEMCVHETLQYQWMRYLPSTGEINTRGRFSTTVIEGLKECLNTAPVLRPDSIGPLRRLGDMRKNGRAELDQNGHTIFADTTPGKYLSHGYTEADLKILQAYGLKAMDFDEILIRVECDLGSFPWLSRMKSSTSEPWHTRAAKLLQMIFKDGWEGHVQQLKRLPLLPLRTNQWTAIKDGVTFYPNSNGLEIPSSFQLRVIDPSAAKNSERRKLFDFLGVQTASVDLVRRHICQRYEEGSRRRQHPTPNESLEDLQFLYLTHDDTRFVKEVGILTSDNRMVYPSKQDIYLTSDDPLGASRLLARTPPGPDFDDGAPGHSVLFINDIYLNNPPVDPPASLPTWTDWLHDTMGVRRDVRLQARLSGYLSDTCRYVAEHRPRKFMSLLNRLWQLADLNVSQNDTLIDELRGTKVLCRKDYFYELWQTFLPTSHNEDMVNKFLEHDDPFYWLQLECLSGEACQFQEWKRVAKDLHFGLPDNDLEFGLTILQYMQCMNGEEDGTPGRTYSLDRSPRGSDGHKKVYDLYVFLEGQVRGSEDVDSARKIVHEAFESESMIFIPAGLYLEEALWTDAASCLWTAPVRSLRTTIALEDLYTQRPNECSLPAGAHDLKSFFCNTVAVSEWDWDCAIDEIESQKEGDADSGCILDLYKWLANLKPSKEIAGIIRHVFEDKGLVYKAVNGEPAWHKGSDCLWTSATSIPGKMPINNDGDYDGLESFFRSVIGVQKMSIRMLYDKLINIDPNTPLTELKGDLLEFSALLPGAELNGAVDSLDVSHMRKSRIFPVRKPDGEAVLLHGNDDFSIVDRASLAAYFRDKVKLLDFDMEQKESRGAAKACTAGSYTGEDGADADLDHRIAIACDSPRIANGYDEFYQTLRGCHTLETKKITTTMDLHQDEKSISHVKDDGVALFIDENTEGMEVYVPMARADREACFYGKLPEHLLEWIMRDATANVTGSFSSDTARMIDEGSIRVVQSVLNADTCGLRGILDEHGMPEVDERYEDEVDNDDEGSDGSKVEERVVGNREAEQGQALHVQHQVQADTPRDVQGPHTPSSLNDTTNSHRALTPSASTLPSSLANDPGNKITTTSTIITRKSMSPPRTSAHPVAGDSPERIRDIAPSPAPQSLRPYRLLLEQVVYKARRLTFPSRAAFDMSAIGKVLSGDGVQHNSMFILPFLLTYSLFERERMVEAAGELFVFELLRHIEPALPAFDIDNWKSNIRDYASAHPEYSNLQLLEGSETADITYRDTSGSFTSYLADKGYLDRFDVEALRKATPLYYLKVKSTPYAYETSFSMSKKQYKRMQKLSQSTPGQEGNFDKVYVILRVFNLGKESASVRVLVDPEGMRRRGEINFKVGSWMIWSEVA